MTACRQRLDPSAELQRTELAAAWTRFTKSLATNCLAVNMQWLYDLPDINFEKTSPSDLSTAGFEFDAAQMQPLNYDARAFTCKRRCVDYTVGKYDSFDK